MLGYTFQNTDSTTYLHDGTLLFLLTSAGAYQSELVSFAHFSQDSTLAQEQRGAPLFVM